MRHKRHIVIPDTQVKPGINLDHFKWIGKYIAEKRPDVVIHLGDHWDMPSLCSYDRGKGEFARRRYVADIESGNKALEILTNEIVKPAGYNPRRVLLRGNHEERILRVCEVQPELEGTITYEDFNDKAFGWENFDFMVPVTIHGIAYCHLFARMPNGTVSPTRIRNGAPNARAQVLAEMRSCTAGHKQGIDIHIHVAGSRRVQGLICGSAYRHSEGYLGPQGNAYWRGIVVKNEVRAGMYDPMLVSLDFLRRKFTYSKGKK